MKINEYRLEDLEVTLENMQKRLAHLRKMIETEQDSDSLKTEQAALFDHCQKVALLVFNLLH